MQGFPCAEAELQCHAKNLSRGMTEAAFAEQTMRSGFGDHLES